MERFQNFYGEIKVSGCRVNITLLAWSFQGADAFSHSGDS
jgi:hypothetical protein